MSERQPDYNRVVIDKIVRDVQHERNCNCDRCMGRARQSIAWVNEQNPMVRKENAEREQRVIDFLSRNETPELKEQRLQNMLGEVAVAVEGLILIR